MTLNELIPNKVSCGEFQVYLKLATTQQSGGCKWIIMTCEKYVLMDKNSNEKVVKITKK